jgi:rhamnogalacturonan endolyase
MPQGASHSLAVLAKNGIDYQDNNVDGKAYQYWGEIDSSGNVTIPRIKAGTYRLTVYADGIFGQYIQDGIVISAGSTQITTAVWTAESAGTELWRIGTPDKSCGEFRHGNERDLTRTNRPSQYRLYWPVHDFPNDFPNGVNFKVGQSHVAEDMNYIHWSVFGGKGNSIRTQPYYANVNNWTISFEVADADVSQKTKATFTIQLAGVKTSAGNNDGPADKAFAQLPYTVVVNGVELPKWTIP